MIMKFTCLHYNLSNVATTEGEIIPSEYDDDIFYIGPNTVIYGNKYIIIILPVKAFVLAAGISNGHSARILPQRSSYNVVLRLS